MRNIKTFMILALVAGAVYLLYSAGYGIKLTACGYQSMCVCVGPRVWGW